MKEAWMTGVALLLAFGVYACEGDEGGTLAAEPEIEGAEIDAAASGVTYTDEVQELLAFYCSPCHLTGGLGGSDFVSSYASAMAPAIVYPACTNAGATMAECSVIRIEDGSMPTNGQIVDEEDLDTLRAWLDAGAPE